MRNHCEDKMSKLFKCQFKVFIFLLIISIIVPLFAELQDRTKEDLILIAASEELVQLIANRNIPEIQNQMDQNTFDIFNINDNLTKLQESIPSAYNDTSMQNKIFTLETENADLKTEISDLNTEMDNLKSEIDTLKEEDDEEYGHPPACPCVFYHPDHRHAMAASHAYDRWSCVGDRSSPEHMDIRLGFPSVAHQPSPSF